MEVENDWDGSTDLAMDLENSENPPTMRKEGLKDDVGISSHCGVLPYQFEPEWSASDEANSSIEDEMKPRNDKVNFTKDATTSEEDSSTESSYDSNEEECDYYNSDDSFTLRRPVGPVLPYQFEPLASPLTEEEELAKADLEKRKGNTDWCICGNCVVMKRVEECICCREADEVDELVEKNCITERKEFYSTCLDKHQLMLAYREEVNRKYWKKPREPEEGEIYKKYRYVAYRRFTRWCYWKLPTETAFPVPSCVSVKIKEALPSDKHCGFTLHVRKSKDKK